MAPERRGAGAADRSTVPVEGSWVRIGAAVVDVRVRVVPRSSRSRIAGVVGDRLRVQVTAPPVEGEANREIAELLARSAGLPARHASVTAGATSRSKTVRLACDDPAGVVAKLRKLADEFR
jgi:uncharacterized protein (TIGR00251 family)